GSRRKHQESERYRRRASGYLTIRNKELEGKPESPSVLPSAHDFTPQCRISYYEIAVKVPQNSIRQTCAVCLIQSSCGNVAVRQPPSPTLFLRAAAMGGFAAHSII